MIDQKSGNRKHPGLTFYRDTKFGTNIFIRKLLNAAKYHGYSFYCF